MGGLQQALPMIVTFAVVVLLVTVALVAGLLMDPFEAAGIAVAGESSRTTELRSFPQ
jgi:hypothetical protein